MKDLEKDIVLYGKLQIESQILDGVRCEVHIDTNDTSKMWADIYDLGGSIGFRFMKDFMWKEIVFNSSSEHEEHIFKGTVSSGQFSGASDKIGRVRIESYEERTFLNREPIINMSLLYFLTQIEMFKRKRMRRFDDKKGLLLGYDDWSDKNKPNWTDESFSYDSAYEEITFYPGLTFSEDENGNVTVMEQIKAAVSVKGENLTVEETKRVADQLLEEYLYIISFLENKFIYWFNCRINARGSSGKGMVSEMYKRIPHWEYSSKSNHFQKSGKEYRELLPKLVHKYSSLKYERKSELDKAMIQLLVASKPGQPYDTELIYWHSCLDILIKVLLSDKGSECKNLGFSKKLILACEKANIEWNDLYSYIKREEVFSDSIKADLKITTFRNKMIHEGIYPEQSELDEVIQENARAAALAERMIMSIFGEEYRSTPIGKYRQIR